MTDFSTNPGVVNVDENGAKYGRKQTGNVPHGLIVDTDGNIVNVDSLVGGIVTTETFHYLSHLGMVFIHGERHNTVVDGANLDMLVRIPAASPGRQVHFRFNYLGKANAGELDIDIILYKGTTVSADGNAEAIVSTNDAVVKSTGVSMFSSPTITPGNEGEYKGQTAMLGEKKSAGSLDMAVPEWIMAPDGSNARDYLIRATNNSGGTVDIIHSLFFFDSEAA